MLDRRHETLKGDREVFTGHDIVQGQVPSLGEDPVKFLGICVKNSSWILLKDPWALCLGLDFKKKKYLEFQCLECLPHIPGALRMSMILHCAHLATGF